ncbi:MULTISPECIES: ABC transporter ATP-binding protein [unclassified Fusibacter]|uniref:ABC transporter ATP-binding protein n=1 Tax=unclassified Fusibacter TaxID=2624464 RepID=UPI001010E44F|nr:MULTISPECIES: ABC transporter ATP-binding protein [unclassified Fusibacter]MCK8060942.1 ABC transporter ATP-binding protein/permease [Fusibacter sp. A2]NPE23238.1 ABC transporter ATP-binding protein [Fusibacter sp. A1]RXV59592.1 ABC transporter ATP-binding protein [Fusibacter sp. A1]
MFKLMKYLKPFTAMLLLAIALLYAQAQADLALPDFMSDIINVGIQQNGISDASPDVVTENDMERIVLFLTETESKEVLSAYELLYSGSTEYEKAVKKFKKIEDEAIYVIKDLDKDEREAINRVMAKAVLGFTSITEAVSAGGDGEIAFGGQTLPAGTDVFKMLSSMPTESREEMISKSDNGMAGMDSSILIQAATRSVRSIYESYGRDVETLQRNYILAIGSVMLLITLVGAACAISVGFLAAKIAAGLGRNLRTTIFTKIEGFSNFEFDKFSTASLITRSTNDVMQIQTLMVLMVRMLFYAPIMGVGGVIKALGKSTSMSWIIAIAVIVLLGLIVTIFSIAMPKFKLVQKMVDRINLVMREGLSGMMVIRAFNTQDFEEKRFDGANKDLMGVNLFVNRVMVFMFPVMMFIMNGVTLLIVWVGADQIAASNMQVGDMMAFMQYALQIIMAFLMLSMMFIMVPRASVSAARISEVLDTEYTVLDPVEPDAMDASGKGTVTFENVNFRYPGAEADMLKNISFTAKPGETTAIIGSTGAGKSTLVNMIPRFYDVTGGKVTIDGKDIRRLSQADVRSIIGYVPQKASLFTGTIGSNLTYGDKNAAEETVTKAVEIAQATDFVESNAQKYDATISQGGANVSGGQKQRLSIARALVKKPKIFIFDDSFSALDFKTDRALRASLKKNTGESTLIIVAQRISTIKQAEQILVIDDGEIVGRGTHGQLMETCKTYQEIAYSQLSKEELA